MDSERTLAAYRVDPKASRLSVQVTAGGLLASFGHNPTIAARDFTGEAQFEPDSLANASVHIEITAATLEVIAGASDKDKAEIEKRMHSDVLQSDSYPLITFDSSNIKITPLSPGQYRVDATGPMTLHGITNNQTLMARVMVSADKLRASGEITLRQTDYGIELVSVAGGALKVKDEVKISFDVAATAASRAKDSAAA